MKKISMVLLVILTLAITSCDLGTIPNPITGTYMLREEGTTNFFRAAFSLNEDGSFDYIEIVENSKRIKMSGTYTYSLTFFDFERANGSISFTLFYPDEILKSGIQNLIIKHGNTSFLFDWEADKNTGPRSLTLVVNPSDRSQNYELVYSGRPGKLPSPEEEV